MILAVGLLDIALGQLGPVAEPEQHGVHRDIDVHVGVADPEPLRGLIAETAIGQHPNHGDPGVLHLERLADGIFGGEEPGSNPVPDDGDR
jgi:hypothetical protein